MALIVKKNSTVERESEILTDGALSFLERLHTNFAGRREALLAGRGDARRQVSMARRLDFSPDTAGIRSGDWKVAPAPTALLDRRVEITGPASPAKMAINALNSGAKVWLADLEDASAPNWFNVIDSQVTLMDAAHGDLAYTSPEGKAYTTRTDAPLAVVVVRPRGWHLNEHNLGFGGADAIASLVDFGLHFFHNASALANEGQGPFYYLPKLESASEARLWNDIFTFAENELGLDYGTVRATVLIETIPAAFQMDEILFELRDHASGLNAGRWDYLFSFIKYFRDAGPEFVLPDRASISMTSPFMRAYTELLVHTCHRRGAFAMGGMAAFIPNRRDPLVTEAAIAKVREDKLREARDGFDGSWVAHPDLVPVCEEVFDAILGEKPNQLDRLRDDVHVSAGQLIDIDSDPRNVTEAGLRLNLYVAVAYTAVWLSGSGAVAIHNLMEDAATAEISRSQVWQQLHNGVRYADTGEVATPELVVRLLGEEVERLRTEVDSEAFERYYRPAHDMIERLCLSDEFVDFLTIPAYELLELS